MERSWEKGSSVGVNPPAKFGEDKFFPSMTHPLSLARDIRNGYYVQINLFPPALKAHPGVRSNAVRHATNDISKINYVEDQRLGMHIEASATNIYVPPF